MPTRKWKTEILVNTTVTGNQDQPAVTALADGGFVIAWRDDGPADSLIRWQRYDAAGVKSGLEQTANAGQSQDQTNPAVVALQGDQLWFVQQDFDGTNDRDIVGTVVTASGTVVRAQDSNGGGFDHVDPAAASLGANGAVSVYVQNFYDVNNVFTHSDIIMRRFDINGASAGEVTVNTNPGTLAASQFGPQVAASKDGSKFAVVWIDQGINFGDNVVRVFNANGTEFTAEFNFTSSGPVGSKQEPQITWLDNGRFVIAWTNPFAETVLRGDGSGASIKYQIVNADGTLFGPERFANSTVYGSQLQSTITSLPNGGFVIAWVDVSNIGGDTSLNAIRLQAFDGAGDKTGGEILVNTTTFDQQITPSITALADGRVVVTWQDNSQFGTSGGDIRAQIVDPRDGIIDGTSGIDKLYGHDAVGDIMTGFAGADTMYGLAGNDVMDGGDGGDFIFGDRGDDTLYGGAGSDYLYGGLGDDEVYGGADGDVLYSSAGTDLFDGGAGNDIIYYSAESVGATINLNNSALNAGSALGDTLVNVERISGTNSADILIGDSAANTFVGNGGNDRLGGGIGVDTLVGGTGSDTFVFAIGNTGQTAATADIVSDLTKGLVGTGDKIDFASNLAVGGVATAATATQASINATTGVATFFAGSGTTMADALADIATSMTTGGNLAGEFAFFKVNNTGNFYQFISDGVAGVGANDVLVQLTNVTAINSINITAGDVTILT